jgi:sulfoxide reductase catalytic subunit YedY
MSEKFKPDIPSHAPTPPEIFFSRRKFVTTVARGILLSPAVFLAAGAKDSHAGLLDEPFKRPDVFPAKRNETITLPQGQKTDLTPRAVAASHNNFYEFLPGQGGPVWQYTDKFEVDPWKIEITGLCNNSMTLDLDDVFKIVHEERLYHFRCVETWAMNVPWSGFSLNKLIKKADPKPSAKYVRFISAHKREQMPGAQQAPGYPWPYHEGLRIDEAMNDLTMAVTGVYGKPLLKQHGAPIRIIVPWKYGYKSPKSVVKIELVAEQPKTFWGMQPHEYGFLSNVNPNIPHPRWSQESSFWLDTGESFPTSIFNGYDKYVGKLYPDEPRTPQIPLHEGQVAR